MNVSLQYKTYNRGRTTSSTSFNLGDVSQYPCIEFTGELPFDKYMGLESVRHIWLSTNYPVDIVIHDENGGVLNIEGIMLYSTEFVSQVPYMEIKRSSWVGIDDQLVLDMQAFASTSRTSTIG